MMHDKRKIGGMIAAATAADLNFEMITYSSVNSGETPNGSILYRIVNLDHRDEYMMQIRTCMGEIKFTPITNSEILLLEKFP